MGLHTIHMFSGGISKYKHIRVEKCGQRGILGKYCMHFHLTGDSPNFELVGNAIEYSQQRAINIHGTHLRVVERLSDRQIKVRFMHKLYWQHTAISS